MQNLVWAFAHYELAIIETASMFDLSLHGYDKQSLNRADLTMDTLTIIQAGIFTTLIGGESLANYLFDLQLYERRDTFISIVLGLMSMLIIVSTTGFFLSILIAISSFALLNIESNWYSWLSLLIICDISYYLIHLMSHKVRFFWASHMLHHSSHKLNYTTVFRGPLFYLSFRMVFWIPMVLIGFSPYMIVVTDTVIQMYTVFTHTTAIGKLGFLERILNTPAHHRLHHASNQEYLDRNFGGMFIIWDRMFGTFIKECEKPIFGLAETKDINNPFQLIFLEWKHMIKDVSSVSRASDKWRFIFGKPGSTQFSTRKKVNAKN